MRIVCLGKLSFDEIAQRLCANCRRGGALVGGRRACHILSDREWRAVFVWQLGGF